MSYQHLSAEDRGKIEVMHKLGMSPSTIAGKMNRHRTTIARELKRNRSPHGYDSEQASKMYAKRRRACRPKGPLAHEPLREYVAEKLAEHRWSPQLIAGRLPIDYPDDPRMRVSHETQYRALYANRYLMDHLIPYLPQARPKRRKRGQGKTRRGPFIPDPTSIHQRPPAVDQRIETGHWEGDLVVGKGQDGFLLTLVERVSRLLHTTKLDSRRTQTTCQAVVDALLDWPVSWVKSVTFDNGSEFAAHHHITAQLGADVYFADAYSAYQRGSNEQVNGLLRRYLPKGTSFKDLDPDELARITEHLNNRPRKCLGYQTPNEVFQQQRQELIRALGA